MPRYHFDDFVLSPRRRLLLRGGVEQPLIPRYFDLLVFLVEHRHEAVHRRDILERVWRDAVVSESALSQAIRTIRRALGDDSREPRFIRTVSRHGYRFVFPEVREEADGDDVRRDTAQLTAGPPAPPPSPESAAPAPQPAAIRWIAASAGGATAGVIAGAGGGLILVAAPDSTAPFALAPVLAVIGGACGAVGGAGVGAGLAVGGSAIGGPRAVAMSAGAAIGGGIAGLAVQWLTRWALAALVGLDIAIGGGLAGVAIGAAAGLGLALGKDHVQAPPRRLRVAMITGVSCGIAGLVLALAGRPLAGGTIHAIADAAEGSRATLAPLGRLIGEPDLGPISGALLAFGEAAVFGIGLALGLTRGSADGLSADLPRF